MPASEPAARSRFLRGLLAALGLAAGAALVLLPWWRNHAYLRDFYDYGLVIAGSYRMSLGEMPYVDFITPIQTLHFLQARWAEQGFGPHYLSLTYANALLIAAAFAGFVAVLRRPLGWGAAILVAVTVVTASSGQHTIVWHNALGVTWMALVAWLTARSRPAAEPGATVRLLLVGALLWLGGMTKLNYQAAALAFAALFALRDGWLGTWSRRRVLLVLAAYGFFGLVAPFVTELLYTGAGPSRWWHNVVVTPQGRAGLLRDLLTLKFYFHTPHDYYKPLLMPFVGAWGVAVLAALVAAAGVRLRRDKAPRSAWLLLAALAGGTWLCSSVMEATNFDIAYLTGALWLALGTALVLALLAEADGRVTKAGRIAVGAAAVTLLVPAWLAAWHGTRALWDSAPGDRRAMVTTDDLPEQYAYFRGLRITAPMHESLVLFARLDTDLKARGQTTGEFYFLNGTEFMLRAFAGKRYHKLPLWLHEGTTYGEESARLIQEKLATDTVRGVVSHGNWNLWRHGIEWYLNTRFQYERVGPMLHVYREHGDPRRNWRDATTLSGRTLSSVDPRDLRAAGGPFALAHASAGADYLGAPRSGRLSFRQPVTEISGELVARRAPAAGHSPLDMVWRVVTTAADGTQVVLSDERIVLAPDEPERIVPFKRAIAGLPVTLELYLPPDQRIEAGFRRLETEYVSTATAELPRLLDGEMPVQSHPETWAKALFADESLRGTPCHGEGFGIWPNEDGNGPQLFSHTPGVVWFKVDGKYRHLAGEFGLGAATWTNRDALNGVRAQVIYYRPGHLQVLADCELRPKERETDRAAQSFAVELPGRDGWVALVFTSLDSSRNSYGHSWWRKVRAW